jgi:hypothetical protein
MITFDQFDRDFEPYVNPFGFTCPDVDHMPLAHGFRVLAEKNLGFLTDDRKAYHKELLQTLIHRRYPGILMPKPATMRGNDFSQDNHKAMFWL